MNLYTIGFTKKSAKDFFALIIKNGIKLVIDTRLNNKSQLAGFAKQGDLEYFLKKIGDIKYIHMLKWAPTDDLLKNYQRKKIDWDEYRAIIIGKGDQQAVVRFSRRCMKAIKDYLAARSELDGNSGKVLSSLPLFARHDRGAGKKLKPITPTTGRNIVAQRVLEAVGVDAVGTITPHSFRHYFVTTVLRGSGGNLKLAQDLARHRNIAVTQRYAHLSDDELDQGYWEIFEES
jgi:hypothetical protein